jgi:hypothetical protein
MIAKVYSYTDEDKEIIYSLSILMGERHQQRKFSPESGKVNSRCKIESRNHSLSFPQVS